MFEMRFGTFNLNRIIYNVGRLIPDNFYPKEPYMIRALLWRQKIDMNVFCLVVGNPRTSKSSWVIDKCDRLCQLQGKEFDIDKQLTFDDIKKFLLWSKDAKGSQFVLDETGSSMSPDQFWSVQQRVMRRFVQTQGFRRNILFWVLPSIVFIQKNFRFLCDYGIKTIRQGKVSIHKIKTDQLLGKTFIEKVIEEKFKKPRKKYWYHYMEIKKKWNDEKLKDDLNYLKYGRSWLKMKRDKELYGNDSDISDLVTQAKTLKSVSSDDSMVYI